MDIKKNIPNTLTLGNLFCGCLAIVKTFEGDLVWAAYLVGIAAVLDFFDGFVARLLKVASPIGKDLDSLADMVTFGVVPGVVMFKMIIFSITKPSLDQMEPAGQGWTIYPPSTTDTTGSYLPYFAFIITLFSCIRLAKFNNDTRQSESFIGLNTPSNSMVICSLPLIMHFQGGFHGLIAVISNPWFLCFLSLVMSLLLVSEIPFFALKFKGFSWADPKNRLRFIFLGLAVILLVSLQFVGIPLVILLYILLSIVNNIFLKSRI